MYTDSVWQIVWNGLPSYVKSVQIFILDSRPISYVRCPMSVLQHYSLFVTNSLHWLPLLLLIPRMVFVPLLSRQSRGHSAPAELELW